MFESKQKALKDKNIKKVVVLGISAIVAAVIFFGLITVQEKLVNPYGKVVAYQMKTDIKKNSLITKDNIGSYIEKIVIPGNLGVSNAITDPNEVVDHLTTQYINKGSILSKNDFIDVKNIKNKIQNPIKVSFNTNDVSEVLAGTLRQGNVIDISVIKRDNESKKIISNAYVEEVFTKDNKEIKGDSIEPTTIINILIPAADLNEFNNALAEGKLRVSMNK